VAKTVLLVASTTLAVLLACGVAVAATVRCEGGPRDPCRGTHSDDTIYGNPRSNGVAGLGGNDVIYLRGGGEDWGFGDWWRSSNPGNDILHGGRGQDVMSGNQGDDTLYGGPKFDELDGGALFDILEGDGNDTIRGGPDGDLAYGDEGDDTIHGGFGDDVVRGGFGADRLYGGEGDDLLAEGKTGAEDYLYCGEGYDTYYPPEAADHVSPTCEEEVPLPPPGDTIAPPPTPDG